MTTALFLLATTTINEQQLANLSQHLSFDELHFANGTLSAKRRKEFLLSRWLLRQELAKRTKKNPIELIFTKNSHGKPQLMGEDWHFNISHSGDWLAIAISPAGPLGLDLELAINDRPILALAKRFYATSEYLWLSQLPTSKQKRAFYRLWSRKEAVLKAHGQGINAGLAAIRFIPEQGWQLDNQLDEQHYHLQDWPFAGGWLSLVSPAQPLVCYQLDCDLNCQPTNPMLWQTLAASPSHDC